MQRKCSQLCGNYSTCTSIVSQKLSQRKSNFSLRFSAQLQHETQIVLQSSVLFILLHPTVKKMRTMFFPNNGGWYQEWLRGSVRALACIFYNNIFVVPNWFELKLHTYLIAFQKIHHHCGSMLALKTCRTFWHLSGPKQVSTKSSWRRKIISWPQGRFGLISGHVKAYPSQGQCD